jgi:ubiquinone/menaquinone biosynthesis C-methylase UbiE
MRDFGDDVFAGTAEFYEKYRAKYSLKLFHDLIQFFGLNGQGRLLDLGCGTGELALPLAKYFNKVVAIDLDPDMLRLGHRKASESGVSNIEWQKGSSRDLKGVKGPFRLVTMGQSFHWMDQERDLEQLYQLIEPNGGLFIVGTAKTAQNKPTSEKDKQINNLLAEYLGPQRRAGKYVYSKPPKSYDELLSIAKFNHRQSQIYETKVVRNVEQELGNLYSMSWGRRAYFGDQLPKFERAFRTQLSKILPPGGFENIVRFETYFLQK